MSTRRRCESSGSRRSRSAGAPIRSFLGALSTALAACGCAVPSPSDQATRRAATAESRAALGRIALDAATEDRILALAPERVSGAEVEALLSRAPAPRIICLHGSVPLVTMQPFAEFLVAMGYPDASVRDPKDGRYSHSSYTDSRRLAGTLAWYYEREAMMPILIGHSQGGMLVIKVLHDLAGESDEPIPVWNPLTDAPEGRFTILDPRTGAQRPVAGLTVGYAAAIATGSLPRVLLGQWGMLRKLRQIPDTVEEFTGFFIAWDPVAGTFPGTEPFRPMGSAAVRTVMLPAAYGHITIPLTRHLAANPVTRAWINEYIPERATRALPAGPGIDATNIVHAAEIWYSIKKHWSLEAQRLIRSRRATTAGT